MTKSKTRPFLRIFTAHHPKFDLGVEITQRLIRDFTQNSLGDLSDRMGIPVMSCAPSSGPIDLDDSETAAVVILVDKSMTEDPAWITYAEEIIEKCEKRYLTAVPFIVSICKEVLGISEKIKRINYFRWDTWDGDDEIKLQRLVNDLSYQCCRILRTWAEKYAHKNKSRPDTLSSYTTNIKIFLSHSKRDTDKTGEKIALEIRDYLHKGSGYDSFFDVNDIPAGLSFQEVLLQDAGRGAFIAIHTDTYSSREWCRREVITAKKVGVPMVVAHAITNGENRTFPYLGNVPVLRLSLDQLDRIPLVIGRLMKEVLKDYLWQCQRVAIEAHKHKKLTFLRRSPELISLVAAQKRTATIIYPDPPLATEEEELFSVVSPKVTLLSFAQWLARI